MKPRILTILLILSKKHEQNGPGLSEAGYNEDWITVEPLNCEP